MASKSVVWGVSIHPKINNLVLILSMFLMLFNQLAAGSDSVFERNTTVPTLFSASLITASGNTSENWITSNAQATTPVLHARDIFYMGEMDENCFKSPRCVHKNDKNGHCGFGYTQVGWEACDFYGNKRKPICCTERVAPQTCKWRGSGGDCNGICHTGEVNVFKSKRGGGFHKESTMGKCSRGWKAFCCEEQKYNELSVACRWTGCGDHCNENEVSIATATNIFGGCHLWKKNKHFCCPKSRPAPFKNCHWNGKGDCAHNYCHEYEVTVGTDTWGGSSERCGWSRKRSLCCEPNSDAVTCPKQLCEFDKSYRCGEDTFADESEKGEEIDNPFAHGDISGSIAGREYRFHEESELDERDLRDLEERAKVKGRRVLTRTIQLRGNRHEIRVVARAYPGSTRLHNRSRGPAAASVIFRPVQNAGCFSTSIEIIQRSSLTRQEILNSVDTEHNPDLQYASALLNTAMTGVLPNGTMTTAQAIDANSLLQYWHQNVLTNLPGAGASRPVRTPNDYFMDRFGSTGNRVPLLLADRNMNQVKGRVFGSGVVPQDHQQFSDALEHSLRTGSGEQAFLEPIRQVILVFRYMNEPQVRRRIQQNRQELLTATLRISSAVPQLQRLHSIHREFDYNWYRHRTNRARDWVDAQLDAITVAYQGASLNPQQGNHGVVMTAVRNLRIHARHIQPPPEDPQNY